MASIGAKILEYLRFIKSDALPRPPRAEGRKKSDVVDDEVPNDENFENNNEQEEIFAETDKTKPKNKYFGKNKEGSARKSKKDKERGVGASNISINTQTMGNVINVIDTNNFRWGNDYVYYIGHSKGDSKMPDMDMPEEENIEKTNLITLLMEATIPAEHEYIDYVSKNIGKNWRSVFRKLGFTRGRIETFEIDDTVHGVAEARYQLLLDWSRNEEDGTLGRLAKLLWEEGERHIVKELSLIYEKNCK